MPYKSKEQEKKYRAYWEKYKRSEKSKAKKREMTRLWLINQRKKRTEQELKNGEELGYAGVKIRNDIRKRIEEGKTKILVNKDGSITCFHKNEDGHWVNNTKGKKYLHREVIKKELGLTEEDLKGLVIHHKDEDKDNNDITNLEIMTQSEHAARHKDKYAVNLTLGRIAGWSMSKEYVKKCEECGIEFNSVAHNAKYCSDACKMKNYRRRKKFTHINI